MKIASLPGGEIVVSKRLQFAYTEMFLKNLFTDMKQSFHNTTKR